MAVGLSAPSRLLPVDGVELAAVQAGIRYRQRNDLVLMRLAEGTHTAAVFTRNVFRAAPVILAEENLKQAAPRYLMINAGNANAGTGAEGLAAAKANNATLAGLAACRAEEILPFSTGVIGEPLPVGKFAEALPGALEALQPDAWLSAAQGIMTTDTVPKGLSKTFRVQGRELTLTGIAKGSGMIRPDMATMLAFIATDAELPQAVLETCLKQAVQVSFNAVTVDGDTSTNDACVLSATGRSGIAIERGEDLVVFQNALDAICRFLAQAMIRDGEGATKFVTLEVRGARDDDEARRVAYTVAHSPLVKTALFAGDPNWGRILAAVGRAGVEDLDIEGVEIHLGDVRIVHAGGRDPGYAEAAGRDIMSRPEIGITIALNRGRARAEVWTCDFSYDYVKINAEYRS